LFIGKLNAFFFGEREYFFMAFACFNLGNLFFG